MKYSITFLALMSLLFDFAQPVKIPLDTTIVTTHSGIINNTPLTYNATAGTQPVWDSEGNPIASLFYTYYERNGVKDLGQRPIIFSFNGGPGSASVWMHIAYTGPILLNIDEEGYPIQPYGVKDNPYSILDIADIVFIDPVNTGYSRMVKNKEGKFPDRDVFFGINADIKYLATWMRTFVTRKNRWESPKFIMGESYGGTRVMGLAERLQNTEYMYLNGVIMVSPADYKVLYSENPIADVLHLPYFTATAWYHKVLPEALQSKDLVDILPEVEDYALNTLLPTLSKGGFVSEDTKLKVAKKLAYYSGISENAVIKNNLRIPPAFFWKELLRDSGYTIGRLDSRYLGIDKSDAGSSPDYNAELSSWLHSFTPPINHYFRSQLNFKTDIPYNMLESVEPWDTENDNTREGLRLAMAQNPYLKVLFQSGYYDGATTYFNAKYTMWQIDPSGKMRDRFTFKGYRSGHMMYLRHEDLISSTNDIRDFIKNSLSQGKPAKYE